MSAPRRTLVIGARGALGAAVCGALRGRGEVVHGLDLPEVDLSEAGSLEPALRAAWAEHGPFDALVYAAGVFPARAALLSTETLFDRVFAVNTRGALLAGTTAAELAIAAGRPLTVVALSSGAAQQARPGTVVYAASKAALEAVIRGLALELGPRGVRFNAVAPGFVDVGSTVNPVPEAYVRALAELSPHGRVATASDILPVVLWLLSAESHWVSGQVLRADGGAGLGSLSAPSWLPGPAETDAPPARPER